MNNKMKRSGVFILCMIIIFTSISLFRLNAQEEKYKADTNIHDKSISEKYNKNLSSFGNIEEYESIRFIAKVLDIMLPSSGYLAKVALAGVIVNRTSHSAFPALQTEAVFSDENMSLALKGNFAREPSDISLTAARDAVFGFSPCGEALWFYKEGEAVGRLKTKKVLYKSGGYVFA